MFFTFSLFVTLLCCCNAAQNGKNSNIYPYPLVNYLKSYGYFDKNNQVERAVIKFQQSWNMKTTDHIAILKFINKPICLTKRQQSSLPSIKYCIDNRSQLPSTTVETIARRANRCTKDNFESVYTLCDAVVRIVKGEEKRWNVKVLDEERPTVVINAKSLNTSEILLQGFAHALVHLTDQPLYSRANGACLFKVDSISSHMHNGMTYATRKGRVWRISTNSKVFEQIFTTTSNNNTQFWKGVPNDFDEAFVWAVTWNSYFLLEDQYYRFDAINDRIRTGYPLPIDSGWPGVPSDIDAAFTDYKLQTHFFKDDLVYRYDNSREHVADNFPKKISSVFPGIPDNIDTAFRFYIDGEAYFFKDESYWRFDYKRNLAVGPTMSTSTWKNLCI